VDFQFDIFLTALGLAFVLESLPYFLAPDGVKRILETVRETSPSVLRFLGFFGIITGLVLVAISRLAA